MGTQNDPSEESADVDVFGEPQDIVQRPSELDPMDSLPSCCTVLTCSDPQDFGREQTFYLVGTAHVVFLELCVERRSTLTMTKEEVLAPGELFKLWRAGKVPLLFVAYSWMLSQVADALGVLPGEEFRAALLEAQQVGAKVVLGDRPVRVTLARTWSALSRWSKVRFIWGLLTTGFCVSDDLKAEVEKMKEADVLTQAMKDLAEEFPELMRPLIQERDEYMVFLLRALASRASKVVAVVGAGHLPGMRERWNAEIDFEEISRMPAAPQKSSNWPWRRMALLGISGVAVTAVVTLRRRR
ncbi:TraB-domain-containing protein [Coccomyxa subellipsoidea C-169]|uniref:TraB-domain-containing protein n=1 Tax=Coccomyxa subellipsoidea (strain C-169) TaxID=574566 RepID=I0Z0Q0_COCSC|nr:TraB-domain-containing protein [Coccomyxa subellipsoidea C-169]EIE24219.1 TraB-domain-containing protein [Coccomyxa subellipsoidea C-169]|eukprot:XP_005648763.1 TraB-domain-containing protein [Coccomyxa subellipsoidea C-169]